MSKIKQLNLDQKLEDLKILINRKEVEDSQNIITVYEISKLFDISFIESTIILNKFVLNENDISQYILFFLCEIIDDSGKNYTKKIISSCNEKINEILEDKKHTLSFGIFGICKIDRFSENNNYRAFIGENILIKKYDYTNVPDNLFKNLNTVSNNKKNLTKNENETKVNKKKINNNKPASKPENINSKNSKKPNIISDKEEENYYDGFIPNKEKPKQEKEKNIINLGANLKRKKSETNDEHSSKSKEKKSKKSRKYSNKSSDDEKSKSKSKSLEKIEPIKEEDVEMKDESQPKKVRRVRYVKKTKQFLDDDGYMVTKEIMEEEEFWEDEKPKNKIIKSNNLIGDKKEVKKNNKKLAKGQTSINAFFGK